MESCIVSSRVYLLQDRFPLAKNVELALVDVLVQLVDECVAVPQAVVEILMGVYSGGSGSAGNNMATAVCQATQDRLQKHVARYFSEALQEVLEFDESSDEDENDKEVGNGGRDDSDEDEDEDSRTSGSISLRTLHIQIVRLAEAVPSLLTSVIPQLEPELESDSVPVRLLATRTLGKLFSMPPSGASESFASLHPHVWKMWLGRAVDKQLSIRLCWVEYAVKSLVQHTELETALIPPLVSRAVDPDEHVRARLPELIATLDYEMLRDCVPLRLFREIGQRGKDRRRIVRDRALDALGRTFSLAYADSDESTLYEKFSWIPGVVLSCHLTGSCDVTRSVIRSWETFIVPVSQPDVYARRLYRVSCLLDENEHTILLHLTNLRLPRPTAFDVYASCCAGDDPSRLSTCIRAITALLNDSNASEALAAFASEPDESVLESMRICYDSDTPLEVSVNTRHKTTAFLRETRPGLADILSACLYTGSFPILNVSCIQPLLELRAKKLLTYVAKHAPFLLQPYTRVIERQALRDSNDALAIELLAALAVYSNNNSESAADFELSETLLDQLCGSCVFTSYATAKLIACVAPERVPPLIPTIQKHIELGSSESCADALDALAACLEYAREILVPFVDTIMQNILHRLILAPWTANSDDNEALMDTDWIDEAQLPVALRARLGALRVMTLCCAVQNKAEVAPPVLKLLWIMLGTGEAQRGQQIPTAARACLRLCAAQSILKLASCHAYSPLILPRMGRLAYGLQDECFQVRTQLLHDLLLHLTCEDLAPAFHAIIFLVAFDPENELRTQVASYTRRLQALPDSLRHERLERVLVRLLYVLAHHPDFTTDSPSVQCSFTRYVDFYLACVANENNISLLAKYAASVRTYIDLSTPEQTIEASRPLHAMAELALFAIQRWADTKAWTLHLVDQHNDETSSSVPCPVDILQRTKSVAPSALDEQVWDLLQQQAQPKRSREKKAKLI